MTSFLMGSGLGFWVVYIAVAGFFGSLFYRDWRNNKPTWRRLKLTEWAKAALFTVLWPVAVFMLVKDEL